MNRRIKRVLIFFVVLMIGFLMAGCEDEADVKEGDDFVYCLNADRTGLKKVRIEITAETTEDAAKTVLSALAKESDNIEYMPVLSEDVKVTDLEISQSVAYIDFNQAYREIPPIQEKLVRAAVVQSLVRLNGISGVWIRVEEENLTDDAGNLLGVLNADDFVETTGSAPSSYETTTLTLYFASEDGTSLVKQQTEVKYNTNVSKEKLIVEKLMKGPGKNGGNPTVNPGASLLGVTIKDGICYVNFDAEFLNSIYDVSPEVTVYSLVNSLIEGTNAVQVQITVNGEKNVKYMDVVDLSQPLSQNLDLIEKENK